MPKPKVVVHTLVKNEQRWLWYALMSVIDQVDEILVWDTGSTDKTPEVVKCINSPKIKFREVGPVDPAGHTAARQRMLEATDADWIMILDGDEIWWHDSLAAHLQAIREHRDLSALISPVINLVGDIYHQEGPVASHYHIGEYRGAFNIRFINRRIPGLHISNPHGRQEYRDDHDTALQYFPPRKLHLVNKTYLHTTHLSRSVTRFMDKNTLKRGFKYRFEFGRSFGRDFIYPEVLYLPQPDMVPDPWTRRSMDYLSRCLLYEPARRVKKLFAHPPPDGY